MIFSIDPDGHAELKIKFILRDARLDRLTCGNIIVVRKAAIVLRAIS